jgi:hypothetical protein
VINSWNILSAESTADDITVKFNTKGKEWERVSIIAFLNRLSLYLPERAQENHETPVRMISALNDIRLPRHVTSELS